MKETPLNATHRAAGAKMIEFGGWEMPVYYAGINDEHRAVRSKAGLFDTSHMGEIEVSGPKAAQFLQGLMPNDIDRVKPGGSIYNALLNEKGGVIDDLFVYRRQDDNFILCVNASNIAKDLAWITDHVGDGVEITDLSESTAMIALQGPASASIVSKLADEGVVKITYLHFTDAPVGGIDCMVSRTGYTGEDGFEFFCPAGKAVTLWEKIMEAGQNEGLAPVGLGARDTLRMEMGYPLWGSDLDEEHTPLESGISWICRWDKGEFIGREALVAQRDEGPVETAVGLEMVERGVPRHEYPVYDGDEEVGVVTSGTMSPSLKVGIALARINRKVWETGNKLDIVIHGKPRKSKITKLPFMEQTSLERSTS